MKEWNNPKLFSLGIENTFDHFCHGTGNRNCVDDDEHGFGIVTDHRWSGIICPKHYTAGHDGNEEHESCCCYPGNYEDTPVPPNPGPGAPSGS